MDAASGPPHAVTCPGCNVPGPDNGACAYDPMADPALVVVVDDSESVLEALRDLLQQVGFRVGAYASAEAFLASPATTATSCLVLDVGLPGMSGPELQRELIHRGRAIPIVFITAQGDAWLGPRLLARGATACLRKPFGDDELLEAVDRAISDRQI
jgi:FixJ family two-component response regulator